MTMTAYDWFCLAFAYLGIGNAICAAGYLRIQRENAFKTRSRQQFWGNVVGFCAVALTWPAIALYWVIDRIEYALWKGNMELHIRRLEMQHGIITQ